MPLLRDAFALLSLIPLTYYPSALIPFSFSPSFSLFPFLLFFFFRNGDQFVVSPNYFSSNNYTSIFLCSIRKMGGGNKRNNRWLKNKI